MDIVGYLSNAIIECWILPGRLHAAISWKIDRLFVHGNDGRVSTDEPRWKQGKKKRQGGEKICRVLQVTKAERRNIALYNKMRISFDKSVGKVELCNFRTLRRPCHGTALFRDAFQS